MFADHFLRHDKKLESFNPRKTQSKEQNVHSQINLTTSLYDVQIDRNYLTVP